MKQFNADPCCSRRPLGNAMRVCSWKSGLRFAERSVYSAILCLCLVASAFAESDARFAKANEEFAAGRFKEAIDNYEALASSGKWSANLFYNLGNAYFRADDLGRAILNYERALALDPRHPEADANLRIVRDEARALELTQNSPERFLRVLNVNQYTIMAAVAFWIGAFGIMGLVFGRRRTAGLVTLSILSLLTFALSTAAVAWIDRGSKGRALAIVTNKGVEARVATADNANSVLALPPGSEIQILSRRGDWTYAGLPNGLRGWISAKDAEPVRL
jgi:tetratricopeptide (TPR) repeat protein